MTTDRLGPEAHEAAHIEVRRYWDNLTIPDLPPGITGHFAPSLSRPRSWHDYTGTEATTLPLPDRYRNHGHVYLQIADGYKVMVAHHEFIKA